jgi:hypothetical protein
LAAYCASTLGSRFQPPLESAESAPTMGGVILRGTAKMLNLIGARPGELATVEHSDDDWYANLLWLEGRKCLLLAHAGTLFSAFVPDVHKSDLVPIGGSVVAFIRHELEAEGLPLDRFGLLDSRSIELAKAHSKSVLGYMNEMARFCDYAVFDYGGLARCDVRELNRQLRRELHLSRRPPGYFVPIELAGGSSGRGGVQRRPSLSVVKRASFIAHK